MRLGWLRRICLGGLLLFLTLQQAAAADPKRVLLLHSFGPHFAPWSVIAARFREELAKQSPSPIDLYESSLDAARFFEPPDERAFVDYLRSLFAARKLDLVVTLGGPAARFFQRYRAELSPSTPLLITGLEQRNLNEGTLTANDTSVVFTYHTPRFVDHILHLLPNTTNVALVIGASPLEKFWVDEMRREFEPLADRVTIEWFNELPLADMLKRAAAMPPRSAILYGTVRVDAAGVPHEHDRVLIQLHNAANVPIFGYIDNDLGKGIVGGPLISAQEMANRAAEVAVRIFRGELAGDIKTLPLGLRSGEYDWRELQRWNISESHLPAGSIVHFREPGIWERHRVLWTTIIVALVLQAAVIGWLLMERYGRRKAELESRGRLLQLMHLNRAAAAGALSASIAHEINQPLGAIMGNAEAASVLLQAKSPDVGQLEEILSDIRRDDRRASEIIQHMRQLLKRKIEVEPQEIDLNEVIARAVHILSPEAKKRQVVLRTSGPQQPLRVRADQIHLEQVIMNLVTNGMDAMTDTPAGSRMLVIETAPKGQSEVEVTVWDSGTGIPNDKLSEVFDTFYTTKEHGTGLGLAITRSIVETYGGKIWAENRAGGVAFRFTLPLAKPR